MERRPFDQGEYREQPERPLQNPEHHHEQRFHFGPWVFNVDQAETIIAERPRETHVLPVESWARAYGLDEPEDTHRISLIGPGPDFDRAYAMTSDLTVPVIIATLHSEETGDGPLLIDGTHRLYRAHIEGMTELPAYVLSVEESLEIREDARYR
jgi:hypothetical protein